MFAKEPTIGITRQVGMELVSMALKNMRFTGIMGFALSLVYGAMVYTSVGVSRLEIWLGAMLVLLCLRFIVEKYLGRIDAVRHNDAWQRGFFFLRCVILLGGVLWGGAVFFVFPVNNIHQQMVLVCLLLGLVAGALSSMASIPGFYRLYISLFLLPLLARFVYEGGTHNLILAVLTVLYQVTLSVMAGEIHKSLFSSVRLRLENEALLQEVIEAKGDLERINAELKNEIEEHKEARRQLQKAQSLAEEASRVKSHFMANMSHELKTPMTGIAGITLQLQQTALSAEQNRQLSDLERCNSELMFLIDNLLDFVELEKGEISLREQVFDLQSMFDELERIFRHKAENKGLILRVSAVDRECRWLNGDPFRLKQILFNLLDNAAKFTDTGEVALSVTYQRNGSDSTPAGPVKGKDAVNLRFCVADTGPGIEPSEYESIFSTFYQIDGSFTRDHGGTGVGLALSRKLVGCLGGRIWCDSIMGQGSKFYVRLTLRIADETEVVAAGTSVETPAAAGSRPTADIRRPEILVVDDTKLNRKLLQAMLQKMDLSSQIAQNGLEALEILARESIDLVFMDIQMPVLDGLSATRIIRRLEQGEGVAEIEQDYAVIPAVLLERLRERLMGGHLTIASITANFISGDESEYLASGLDYNLPKPFQPEDITNFIRQFSPLAGGGVEDGIAVAANGSGSEAGSSGQETRKSVTVASRTEVEQFLREKYYFADDAIEMMMASLRESLRNNFAEATQALEREDFEGLSRVAHSIKGSLANIGFSELADQAHEIEVSALQRPDLPYAEMIARLQEPLSELM